MNQEFLTTLDPGSPLFQIMRRQEWHTQVSEASGVWADQKGGYSLGGGFLIAPASNISLLCDLRPWRPPWPSGWTSLLTPGLSHVRQRKPPYTRVCKCVTYYIGSLLPCDSDLGEIITYHVGKMYKSAFHNGFKKKKLNKWVIARLFRSVTMLGAWCFLPHEGCGQIQCFPHTVTGKWNCE